MAKLLIEVECGEKICGECDYLFDKRIRPHSLTMCLLLKKSRGLSLLKHKGKMVYRCPACLAAEKRALDELEELAEAAKLAMREANNDGAEWKVKEYWDGSQKALAHLRSRLADYQAALPLLEAVRGAEVLAYVDDDPFFSDADNRHILRTAVVYRERSGG